MSAAVSFRLSRREAEGSSGMLYIVGLRLG